jgi:hypothetical protein
MEEMTGERLSYSETSKVAREISEENLKRVCGILNDYWSAVEALANVFLCPIINLLNLLGGSRVS